jgi:CO/xanthine dehydrogenase FAD-binding subunit
MRSGNTRQVKVEELYSGDSVRPLQIAPDEILSKVLIPPANPKRGAAYAKFSLRGALEFAALSVAAVLDLEEDGRTCAQARIAVGAVSAAPMRAMKTESYLKGQRLSDSLFSEAAQRVVDEARLVPHHGYSHAYLSEALRVQCRRVLASAAERISS